MVIMSKVYHICQEINGRIEPVNGPCDNFSYTAGCLGHELPDITASYQETADGNIIGKMHLSFDFNVSPSADISMFERATNGTLKFVGNQHVDTENSDNSQQCNATDGGEIIAAYRRNLAGEMVQISLTDNKYPDPEFDLFPTCTHCGALDKHMKYIDQYANGELWECLNCGHAGIYSQPFTDKLPDHE